MVENYYEFYETDEIKNVLMYRKVVKVVGDTLFLDNGIELEVVPNIGCDGCGSGCYEIVELNGCDNIITDVELVREDIDDLTSDNDTSYKIFVYAEDKKIKLVQVDGSDGNGYYGTGYSIMVRMK